MKRGASLRERPELIIEGMPFYGGTPVMLDAAEGKGYGHLTAWDVAKGAVRWRYRDTQPMMGGALSMAGGVVFSGNQAGYALALDAETGELIWKARTGEVIMSRPRLEGDLLFVTSYDKAVYCFDAATGEPIDRLETGGSIYSSPVIDGDFMFFGNNEGEFYCINYRSSRQRWKSSTRFTPARRFRCPEESSSSSTMGRVMGS